MRGLREHESWLMATILALGLSGCAEAQPDHQTAGSSGSNTAGAGGSADAGGSGGSGAIPNAPQGGGPPMPMGGTGSGTGVDAGMPDAGADSGTDSGTDAATGNAPKTEPPAEDCTSQEFELHLYWFCTGDQDWDPARAACMAVGGDLVVIDSTEEQAFLMMHITGDDWLIGLNKKNASTMNAPDTWEWVDGSLPTAYMNWDEGEPDSLDCAVIRDTGKWQDFSCTNDHPFICEVE